MSSQEERKLLDGEFKNPPTELAKYSLSFGLKLARNSYLKIFDIYCYIRFNKDSKKYKTNFKNLNWCNFAAVINLPALGIQSCLIKTYIMDDRLKQSLQQIIWIIQESDGSIEYSRLIKRLIIKGRDEFYTVEKLLDKLRDLGFIEKGNGAFIKLTMLGNEFVNFDQIDYQKYRIAKAENLNLENLELQNESLKIQNSKQDRQIEIDKLTIENLYLQNKQMKRYILYSIIAFVSGAILTNIKDIVALISNLTK